MALKKYAIWDKQTSIITPIGEVFSPDKWIARYPVAGVDSITIVCAAGDINGAYFGILSQMVQIYESQGADFSQATTDEEKLEVIEAFEDSLNNPEDTGESTAEERIAAALEYNNLLNSPVVNEDDPDAE